MLRWLLIILVVSLLLSCASTRKKANCSEIRYRLDHMQYTEDQKEWIEGEWQACMLEYDSLARLDSARYGGIYAQFRDSTEQTKDSASLAPAEQP